MKAIGYTASKPIDQDDSLFDFEMEAPSPKGHDLLVRVQAISVNPVDYKIRMRRASEDGQPVVLGWDAVGVVEAVGDKAKAFKPGDSVWYAGAIDRPGTNAELHLVDERIVGRKPTSASSAEAAALPLVSLTALQALRDEARIEAGHSLCINGASGGVGTMAVQIGKILGAEVTAVSSAENHDFLRELGADHCLDYRQVDISKQERRYDIFFDVFGNQPFKQIKPILSARGVWVSTVLKRHVYDSVAQSKISGGKKAKMVIVHASRPDLERVSAWVASGRLKPIIHALFPLDRIQEAQAQQETKHSRGKIVVSIP